MFNKNPEIYSFKELLFLKQIFKQCFNLKVKKLKYHRVFEKKAISDSVLQTNNWMLGVGQET